MVKVAGSTKAKLLKNDVTDVPELLMWAKE
jgi:hypothetical protein